MMNLLAKASAKASPEFDAFFKEFREEQSAPIVDAVAAEREACARLIEALPPGFGDLNRNDVAALIRARGQTG